MTMSHYIMVDFRECTLMLELFMLNFSQTKLQEVCQVRREIKNYELRFVSCYFKKIDLGVASYFLRVAVLKE